MTTHKETITARELGYTAVFEPAEEGGYVVFFPALPNLMTQGETLNEAREMALECLQCYLESLQEDNLPIPEEQYTSEAVLERLKVTVEKGDEASTDAHTEEGSASTRTLRVCATTSQRQPSLLQVSIKTGNKSRCPLPRKRP